MTSASVQAAFTVLLFVAAAQADSGGVKFSGGNVTMTCPEIGTWFKKDNIEAGGKQSLEVKYENGQRGFYHCEYTDTRKKYYFYFQGKVCDNCFELNATSFGLIISVDIFITAVGMMMIYRCMKRRSSAGLVRPSKAPVRSGGRGPPVPSPVTSTYEHPNPLTRTQDVYSKMNMTR